MQNTGQGSEKKSYRVILLLVVGLAAFSSAMKELNQVHALTLQTSELIAQWSEVIAPAGRHETREILAKVETCDSQIPVPPMPAMPRVPDAPLPAVPQVELQAPEINAPALVPPTVSPAAPSVPPAPRRVPDVPKPRRVVRPDHDAAEVRVLLSTDDVVEKSLRDALEADVTLKALKAKNRRHQIFISPDGKEVILKSLNRSINLRSAS